MGSRRVGVKLGDPQMSDGDDILTQAQAGDLTVEILSGHDPLKAKGTGQIEKVKDLLAPLLRADVPFIRCIGVNYKTHSKSHALPTL